MCEAYDKLLIELGCCAHDRQAADKRRESKQKTQNVCVGEWIFSMYLRLGSWAQPNSNQYGKQKKERTWMELQMMMEVKRKFNSKIHFEKSASCTKIKTFSLHPSTISYASIYFVGAHCFHILFLVVANFHFMNNHIIFLYHNNTENASWHSTDNTVARVRVERKWN